MKDWCSDAILLEPNLRLTAEEKSKILAKMPPPSIQDHQIYVDAVFEGGGVRGIAFLGALRCCDDLGFRWRKLAGTSAGAITAAFVAANFPIDDLETLVGCMDMTTFLTDKTSPFIFNGNPANDLRQPVRMVLNLLLVGKLGQYSSDPFQQWLDRNLQTQGLKTFADLDNDPIGRDLKVIVSDITRGQMVVLPDDLSRYPELNLQNQKTYGVAEAVRLSMSIPFFFKPENLGSSKIVDGGILSNFPLWLYDVKRTSEGTVAPPNPSSSQPPRKYPRWPTFGFRLTDSDLEKDVPIQGPFDLLGAMFRTMMVAHDRFHLDARNTSRIININVGKAKVTATEFDLSDQKKNELYRAGYLAAKKFFLEQWSWDEHLRLRGFDPELARQEAANS